MKVSITTIHFAIKNWQHKMNQAAAANDLRRYQEAEEVVKLLQQIYEDYKETSREDR